MPSCAAVGCSNRREKGFLMKSFPRNKERRAIWAAQVNRAAWFPGDRSCLCQIHFESCMWLPGTTKLKPTAIPTLLLRQPKHQRSSKKYFEEESLEENLIEEEETMMWIGCPPVSHKDPLSLTEDNNVENSRLHEPQTEPLVMCKEEIEVWTEDCMTGIQRIENFKLLEKYYETSENLTDQVTNDDIPFPVIEDENEIGDDISREMLWTSPLDVIEDVSLHAIENVLEAGDSCQKEMSALMELQKRISNSQNEIFQEEIEIFDKGCYKPLHIFPNGEEESRETLVTGI